ncbi:HAD family hydrolase [Undibacterium sp. Ji50W]|uniref:HAD family hydrolase n=1 Tax=Undibacterium sp. Ji50W TaxID=3413041 RepID=UPI003BF447C5
MQLEIDSLSLYPDTTSTLLELRKAGLKIAVCSNLAGPYAAPVMALLPVTLDAYIWSFEVRAIKPEPIIYSSVSDALNIAHLKSCLLETRCWLIISAPKALVCGACI